LEQWKFDHLPKIRTADYDDLSFSTLAEQGGEREREREPVEQPPGNWKTTDQFWAAWRDGVAEDGHGDDNEDQDRDDDDSEDEGEDEARDYDENEFEDEDDEDNEDEEGSDDSVSTWSGDSHFTEIQQIDLEAQARGDWNYRQGHLYYLGSIWDLRSRRDECDLCWRLWRQVRKNPVIKNEYMTKSRCVIKLMELKGRRTDGSNNEVTVLNLVFVYGYKLGDPRNSPWTTRISFVFHGTHRDVVELREKTPEDQIIPFDDKLYGEARWRNDECDYELFREWLRLCETKHAHPRPEIEGDLTIRLIDVEQKCLIEWSGPVSKAPRYVALSYVWGMSEQQAMLASYEFDDCFDPGFFDGPLDQTVADAFEVVARIGEKYLWIDACCIIQDSPEDKAIQIKQMGTIYSTAVLTIVAAFGKDADAGLPGVAYKSRCGSRFSLELKDIRVLFRATTKVYKPHERVTDIGFMENYIENAPYLSRAWTFQEGHLSTCLLIFAKEQVYFECPKCTWCEETHWESESIDFMGWRAVKDPTPDDVWSDTFERMNYDIISPEEYERLKSKPRRLWNSYADLVKTYTSRRLTHDTDILNACTGVFSSITEREKSQFVSGLRTRYFGNDLLFNILSALPRRFQTEILSVEGLPLHPTWSWTAWKGMIEIANEPRESSSHDLVENLVPCDGVRCYMLHLDPQGNRFLQVINENGGWRFERGYVRKGEGIYDPTDFHPSSVHKGAAKDSNEKIPSEVDDTGGTNADERVENRAEVDGGSIVGTGGHRESTTVGEEASSELAQGTWDLPHRGHRESQVLEESPANVETSSAKSATQQPDLPSFEQTLTLSSISSHPAFSKIVPGFHIIFATFASTVVVRTEVDDFSLIMSNTISAGTKMSRAGAMSSNKDILQRKVFACQPAQRKDADGKEEQTTDTAQHPPHDEDVEESSCPCCGKDTTPDPLPPNLELGTYLGRLPPLSNSWDAREYMETVPDGVYKLLWMNNNQLPMFGHLLCKPVSEEASNDGNWDGEILQRVSGVVGPTNILDPKHQKDYAAEWGTFILG
jgi:hypothetical protein